LNYRPLGLGCKFVVGAVIGAMIAAQAPLAHAQGGTPAKPSLPGPDLSLAKKSYAEGEKKYKAHDFSGALIDFKAANDIKPTPQAERYVGLCEDALGHYPAAVDWYEKFLAHVPDKLTAQSEELKKRVSEIKAMPGKVHIESNPAGASVTIDEKPSSGVAPIDVELSSGTHKIKFSSAGRLAAERQIEVAYASAQTVTANLDPEPMPAPAPLEPPPQVSALPPVAAAPAPPPPEPKSLVPAYVTGGLAIAAAGVGTVFGIIALNDKSDFDKNPTSSTADNGDTHSLIADMAFGVALTFGVTSAVLFLTKDETAATSSADGARQARATARKRSAVTVVPTPIVSAHAGGGGVLVRF